MKLIEINPPNFNVNLDIRYATKNNFTGKPIYSNTRCYLIEKAAKKLKKAIKIACQLNYKLKIYDAYRPEEAQYKLWKYNPDPNFLSDPKKGSPHTRGIALDLTLLDSNMNELDMGTKFDEFSEASHHDSNLVSKNARINRSILLSIMTISGFDFYLNEWWHYQLFNSKKYPLIRLNDKN